MVISVMCTIKCQEESLHNAIIRPHRGNCLLKSSRAYCNTTKSNMVYVNGYKERLRRLNLFPLDIRRLHVATCYQAIGLPSLTKAESCKMLSFLPINFLSTWALSKIITCLCFIHMLMVLAEVV